MVKQIFILWLIFLSSQLYANVTDFSQLNAELNALKNIHLVNIPTIINSKTKDLIFKEIIQRSNFNKGKEIWAYGIGGYYWINLINAYLFGGERNDLRLHSIASKDNEHFREELAKNYKIHLMPKDINGLIQILANVFDAIARHPELSSYIHDLKFINNADFSSIESLKKSLYCNSGCFPIIVIYPASGQDQAEYLLNVTVKITDGIPGIDIMPRYNKKVNDLVYYAQGDGDDKADKFLEEYYEKDRIFYKKDFEGIDKDYSLKIDPTFNFKM